MLRSKACRNCASGHFKCKNPCIFSEMQRDDYNAVRNHFGREMFKRHIEHIETTAAHLKDKLWTGASNWWSMDPIEGTFGEIARMKNENSVISTILVHMSKALEMTTPDFASKAYESAKDAAAKLTPHHPMRLALAIAQSKHLGSLLKYESAIQIAQEAINGADDSQLTDDTQALCQMLRTMVTSLNDAQAGAGVNLNDDSNDGAESQT